MSWSINTVQWIPGDTLIQKVKHNLIVELLGMSISVVTKIEHEVPG